MEVINKKAKIKKEVPFYRVGEVVLVRSKDSNDDLFFITKPHEKSGIWVKDSVFIILEEKKR